MQIILKKTLMVALFARNIHIGTQGTQLIQVNAKVKNLKRIPSSLSMGNNQPINVKKINHSSGRKDGSLRPYISQATVRKNSDSYVHHRMHLRTFNIENFFSCNRQQNSLQCQHQDQFCVSSFCTDTDECLTQCLDRTHSCANTVGGFICMACQPGYKRNTSHPNECQGKPN